MEKYSIYIGIMQNDMKTENNKDEVLKATIDAFKFIGVLGASAQFIKGVWNGETEDTLLFSFLNTENVKEQVIKIVVEVLRDDFKQECVLIEKQEVTHTFI